MYASYAEGSSKLDERLGNTIIYAHARDGLFMNLNKVKIDDRIVVFGSESIYEFIVTETKNIYPDEVNDLISVGDHNLTLFTCDGYGDQYRLLIKAVRVTNNNFNTKEVI